MIRFTIKAAICGSAVYYASEKGVFKSPEEAKQAYDELKTVVQPYVRQVTSQIPVEFPELPQTDGVVSTAKKLWNNGVNSTFTFLINSPDHLKNWTSQATIKLKENEEFKKFLDSFSASKENVIKK